jgi:type VI secretion system protein ImpL
MKASLTILLAWQSAVPYVAATVGALLLAVVLVIVVRLLKARGDIKKAKQAAAGRLPPADDDAPKPTPLPTHLKPGVIPRTFKRASVLIRRSSASKEWRYDIPWMLVTGPRDSDSTAMVDSVRNVGAAIDPRLEALGRKSGVTFGLMDGGVLIDVDGHYFQESTDGNSSKPGFPRTLKMLRRFRKARPLDGIVLTIPAQLLLSSGPRIDEERVALAQHILERHQTLQRQLGLRCPIYIVITRCEELDGFEPFVRAMPEAMTDGILGWSNPYSLDANFRDEWIGEAYRAIQKSVSELQLATLAQNADIADREGFFLFRRSLAMTENALKPLVSSLFKQTVYLEPFLLRGIYFCGAATPDSGAGPALDGNSSVSAPLEHGKRVLFTKRLFNDKVLAETGLVRLAARAYQSRQRTVRALQTFVALAGIVLSIGMGVAWHRVDAAVLEARGALEQINVAGQTASGDISEDAGGVQGPQRLSRSRITRTLSDLSDLRDGAFREVFLPTSYISEIETKTRLATGQVYAKLIFPYLRQALGDKTRSILTTVKPGSFKRPGVSLERTPAFEEMRRRVELLKEVSALASTYNKVFAGPRTTEQSRDNLKTVAQLGYMVTNLVDTELQKAFFTNATYHEQAMADAFSEPFDATNYRAAAKDVVVTLATDMFKSGYEAVELEAAVERLRSSLVTFRDYQVLDSPSRKNIEPIKQLAVSVEAAERRARQTRFPELSGVEFAVSASVGALFDDIKQLRFFARPSIPKTDPAPGRELVEEINKIGRDAFAAVQDKTRNVTVPPIGNLIKFSTTGNRFELHADLVAARGAFNEFVNLDFAKYPKEPNEISLEGRTGIAEKAAMMPTDFVISWKGDLLQRTKRLIESFDSVSVQYGWGDLAPVFRDRLLEVGRVHGERNVALELGAAAVVRPLGVTDDEEEDEEESEGESAGGAQERDLARLISVMPVLDEVREGLARIGFKTSNQAFDSVITQQAALLTLHSESVLDQLRPYRPIEGALMSWMGEEPPAFPLFSATDIVTLRTTIAEQRNQVKRLARYWGTPLVKLLDNRAVDSAVSDPAEAQRVSETLEEWKGIVGALKAADAKQPGNSVDSLDTLILVELIKFDSAKCEFSKTAGAGMVVAEGRDYFVQAEAEIRAAVLERCKILRADRAYEALSTVAETYLNPVLNKFPFCDCTDNANPADARRALDAVQEYLAAYETDLQESGLVGADRALKFLRHLRTVDDKVFKDTLTLQGNSANLSFDTGVVFRVNESNERGAFQVIEWEYEVGSMLLGLRNSNEQWKRWVMHDPVRMVFRWARDGYDTPLRAAGAAVRVEGDRVGYSYLGPWSVIRLIKAHQASSGVLEQQEIDRGPHVLQFNIETRRDKVEPTHPNYDERREARLFIRVKLREPKSKREVSLESLDKFIKLNQKDREDFDFPMPRPRGRQYVP